FPLIRLVPSFSPSPTRRSSDLISFLLIFSSCYYSVQTCQVFDHLHLSVSLFFHERRYCLSLVIADFKGQQSLRLQISSRLGNDLDRKSTRLNSSHVSISYAVFC